MKYAAIGAGFEALSLPGVAPLIRALSRSRGVILTLHRVLPEPPASFAPNAILQVTPDFLEAAIVGLRRRRIDIVPLDEAIARLADPAPRRRFAVLTFDDAYRDNLIHALPVLRKHRAPFTLYVPTALVDGAGEVWWQALEDIIAANSLIEAGDPEVPPRLAAASVAEKEAAFAVLYRRMRQMPETERVALLRRLAARYGLDLAAHCRALIMDWAELAVFADEKLCTIGAHTVRHYELSKLEESEMRDEIARSVSEIARQFGRAPVHFSYPIGSPVAAGPREYRAAAELGLRSAVTTRPGGLYAQHAGGLHALPRVSLNGLFQKPRYVDVFATGAIFSAMSRISDLRGRAETSIE